MRLVFGICISSILCVRYAAHEVQLKTEHFQFHFVPNFAHEFSFKFSSDHADTNTYLYRSYVKSMNLRPDSDWCIETVGSQYENERQSLAREEKKNAVCAWAQLHIYHAPLPKKLAVVRVARSIEPTYCFDLLRHDRSTRIRTLIT